MIIAVSGTKVISMSGTMPGVALLGRLGQTP